MAITVDIEQAKTQLETLVELVERGEKVIIAAGGKPRVMLSGLKPAPKKRELGFLQGYDFHVPEDFNEMGREEIEKIFYGLA